MAFPTIVNTTSGGGDADDPILAPLPASLVAGNLIIVAVSYTDETITAATPSGWDLSAGSDMSDDAYVIYTRTSDGSEGATLSINMSSAVDEWGSFAYQISDWTSFEFSAPSQGGSGTQPDPPNFTPALGADDILWIVSVHCSASNHNPAPAPPTDYTAGPEHERTSVTTRSAHRSVNASSQNPGAYNCTGTTHGWDSLIVAVYPESDDATGTGASTLAGVTSAGSGATANQATGTSLLDGVTSAGSGIVAEAVTGTGTSTLAGVTSAGVGNVIEPVSGTGSSTLQGVTSAGTGTLGYAGTGTSLLDGVVSAGSGLVANPITGTGSSTLQGVTSTGVGMVLLAGKVENVVCDLTGVGAVCDELAPACVGDSYGPVCVGSITP